jgi:glycosyltransferase involved in cell wall biosynthesis
LTERSPPHLIVAGDFVTTGGMDRANYALADRLARRGDEVHLVGHRASAELLAYPNVIFHRVAKPFGSYLLGGPLLDRSGRHWARRIIGRSGRVIVNGGNCQWGDVNWVHYVHAAYTPHVAGNLTRRVKGRWEHRLFLATERRALLRARVVIANSRRTKRDLVERVGVPEDRIHVVYYGGDREAFRPATSQAKANARAELGWPAERPAVAFVGALGDRRKGFDILLEAWLRLCVDPAWAALLVVVGAGAELQAWKTRVSHAGATERVRFLGFRSDVPTVLAACDALISPARYEAYGLGVHEALCCGLPVLVSADAGVVERFNRADEDWSALLLSGSSGGAEVAEVCAALRRWNSARQHYVALAARASDRLRSYTWDDMADALIQAISAGSPSTFRRWAASGRGLRDG